MPWASYETVGLLCARSKPWKKKHDMILLVTSNMWQCRPMLNDPSLHLKHGQDSNVILLARKYCENWSTNFHYKSSNICLVCSIYTHSYIFIMVKAQKRFKHKKNPTKRLIFLTWRGRCYGFQLNKRTKPKILHLFLLLQECPEFNIHFLFFAFTKKKLQYTTRFLMIQL